MKMNKDVWYDEKGLRGLLCRIHRLPPRPGLAGMYKPETRVTVVRRHG